MSDVLKIICIAVYMLAIVAATGVLPPAVASALVTVAAVLLGLHVLELLVAFRFVKRYRGPVVDSIALTLLFGFLHWRPLAKGA